MVSMIFSVMVTLGQWITAWLPTKGDTLTAAIETQNWDKEGERRSLQCGFFILSLNQVETAFQTA